MAWQADDGQVVQLYSRGERKLKIFLQEKKETLKRRENREQIYAHSLAYRKTLTRFCTFSLKVQKFDLISLIFVSAKMRHFPDL
jgi:hypothetical protein